MRPIWGVLGMGGVVWTVCCGSSASGGAGDGGTTAGSPRPMGASSGSANELSAGQTGRAEEAGAGGQSGEADAPLSPGVVSGSVLDYELTPVGGVAVEIDGKLTTSDANGHFEVSGVRDKYDAYVIAQALPGYGSNEVMIYEGMSDRRPRLFVSVRGPARTAKIRGMLSGGAGFPLPERHAAALVLEPINAQPSLTGASYELAALAWRGSPQRVLTIGALSWENDASGLPASYDGYGEVEVTVRDGATLGVIDGSTPQTTIKLTPVEARRVTGTLDLPDGCTPRITVYVEAAQIVSSLVVPKSFSYLTPIVAQHPTDLNVQCNFAGSGVSVTSVTLGTTSALELSVLRPPLASLPIDGATNVRSDTVFAWSGEAERGRVDFVFDNWRITRFRVGHATTFPDLSRFGLSYPEAANVTWQVSTFCDRSAPTDGADAASGSRVSCFARSAWRTFSTPAPPKPKD